MSTLLCLTYGSLALETLTACPSCSGALHLKGLGLAMGSILRGGQYRIEGFLSQGGFGITDRAFDVGLSRVVILQELFPTGLISLGSPQAVHIAARCWIGQAQGPHRHLGPHVVRTARSGVGAGAIGVGEPHRLHRHGVARGLHRAKQTGSGSPARDQGDDLRVLLSAFKKPHAAGVMYRDLKPKNILHCPKYYPVLINFVATHAFELRKSMQIWPHSRRFCQTSALSKTGYLS